ncbi:hypothetical protein SUGI_0334640 [Cryptomeria japonica]|uniref:uncharacterized protein LOC131076198 n=1 Tax=Cryptomeria japonica TaxID=3369 RepID=UPI002408A990|nr:uncharacterized protein LOC131076198 [Cryptomeria japonica]XP_057869232.1 uncharacterized protein LOC131076198 [Cryptomeria japonica]XP_057869233.1 uncharacterized protein LOC131076198 [Cryptomeria japonica]GLJ18748.1 hypothetical protein SUGI_0334640 [Cryptomeria japonica]
MRSLPGPVTILWDIENCPVPADVHPEDVASNIRMALQLHPVIKGVVTMFSAYGDFNIFPRKLREGCQRTGVNLIDVPNGKKDAADKAILVDMFLFALDNPPPSTILLISGDVDFAPALHKLGQRGYTVVLAIPARVGVSSALCNAGRFVWDWPSVARGEGLVPAKSFWTQAPDMTGYHVGLFSSDKSNLQNDEEAILYTGIRQNEYNIETDSNQMYQMLTEDLMRTSFATKEQELEFLKNVGSGAKASPIKFPAPVVNAQGTYLVNSSSSMERNQAANVLPATSTHLQTSSHPEYGQPNIMFNETNLGESSVAWVQPGDIQGLKRQLATLVNVYGGSLPLVRVPSEYHKAFGRPLYLAEYGSYKLVNLIKKMDDVLTIEGKRHKKFLCLRELANKCRRGKMNGNSANKDPTDMIWREEHMANSRKGKGIQEYKNPHDCNTIHNFEAYNTEANLAYYSDEGSDDDRGSDQDEEDGSRETIFQVEMDTREYLAESKLEIFKHELQELLVSHACKILLTSFLALYQQRYAKDLDFRLYGVKELEALVEKVKDVAVIREEQGTKRKYIVVNCFSDMN